MRYAVVIYPELEDASKIQELRRKHDPYFDVIEPHITLVFPFPETDRDVVVNHVTKILGDLNPFNIRLKGLTKSFDNWLYLIIEQGNEKMINKCQNQLENNISFWIYFLIFIGFSFIMFILFKNWKKFS